MSEKCAHGIYKGHGCSICANQRTYSTKTEGIHDSCFEKIDELQKESKSWKRQCLSAHKVIDELNAYIKTMAVSSIQQCDEIDELRVMARRHGGTMKNPAITALEALGHVKVANKRCEARYKDSPSSVPGPRNPPVWCDLTTGHEGPHRHVSGHHWVTMDREHLIEMKPLPDLCQKCGTRWPCKDAETVLKAFSDPEPCDCYPNHCTDTSHGECFCNPTREGNLIIHNQGA